MVKTIETERLLLRGLNDADDDFIFSLHLNPMVTEFLYGDWNKKFIKTWMRMMKARTKESLQVWLIENKATQEPVGFVGVDRPDWDAFFTPCLEIGWRFVPEHWGKGYAVEAAKAVIHHFFHEQNAQKLVAFASAINDNSLKVMEKLGMKKEDQVFYNPDIPREHPLARCVVYSLQK